MIEKYIKIRRKKTIYCRGNDNIGFISNLYKKSPNTLLEAYA